METGHLSAVTSLRRAEVPIFAMSIAGYRSEPAVWDGL